VYVLCMYVCMYIYVKLTNKTVRQNFSFILNQNLKHARGRAREHHVRDTYP